MSEVVRLRGVVKIYGSGALRVEALRGVDLTVARGEFLCIMGPSGSGKTTLLNIISTLDRPTRGDVKVCGVDVGGMGGEELARFRLRHIGVVFQFHNLLPELTALDNVALPLIIGGVGVREARRRAEELLRRMGVGGRLAHRPSEMSGGERQRVAVARALATEPELLVCDEPTGSLDYKSKLSVLELLREANREMGVTVIVATHDPLVSRFSTRVLQLVDGVIKG